jgi:hypothetical protein
MQPGRDSLRKRALQDLIRSLLDRDGLPAALSHPLMIEAQSNWDSGHIADFIGLKALTALAARRGNHEEWLRLLAAFDPALPLDPVASAPQIGGLGPGALNSGREVMVDGERCYQKIYLGTSRCFQRMRHAYRHILEPLQPVKFPPVRRIRTGEKLVVVDFDFVDGLDPGRARVDRAFATARHLGAVLPPGGAQPRWHADRYPQDLRFAQARLMDRNWGRGLTVAQRLRLPRPLRAPVAGLIDRLAISGHSAAASLTVDLARWSGRLNATPRVFSHGDLNRANVTDAGLVIDWDNAGWRAYGYDAAYAAAFHTDARDIGSILSLSAAQVERAGHEVADRFAFVFFLLHHLPAVGAGRMPAGLGLSLIDTLQTLESQL